MSEASGGDQGAVSKEDIANPATKMAVNPEITRHASQEKVCASISCQLNVTLPGGQGIDY